MLDSAAQLHIVVSWFDDYPVTVIDGGRADRAEPRITGEKRFFVNRSDAESARFLLLNRGAA
ncbi:hypothetical protein ACGFKX_15630 [Pseudonocardia alni]|uniref:hypothetical protein n=1 Tax=Pseudonocardia alni TaxID=33907 RepID=UPI0037110E6E